MSPSTTSKADTGLKGSGVEVLHRTLAGLEDFDLTGRVAYHADSSYLAGGAYSDIRIGECAILGRGRVAVKCIRLYLRDNPEVIKLIEREVRVWSKLNNPNILPLLGYTIEQHGLPALISEFMDSGTILKYVQAHPVSDIMHMVLGLVEGISYLHNSKIIHSDIKSDNVLVSQIGEPLICDFGISRLIAASHTMAGHGLQAQSSTIRGSARWMSPELLLPSGEHAVHSKESDIWAFGMTVYEVLAKRRPYYRLVSDPQVITSIICRELPRKPRVSQNWPAQYHLLWDICKACWSLEPAERPSASHLASVLKAFAHPSADSGSNELISTVHRSFSIKSEHRRGSSPCRKNRMLPTRRPTYNTFADMGIPGRKLESETRSCIIM